jgi:hypothetical protein
LPRVVLMEKARSVLETPRAAIERGRSNPRLGIGAIAAALLLIAWIAWAIYVTDDNGATAGLGVVLTWPVLLAALALVAAPFVGLFFLITYLRSTDEAEEAPSISGGSAAAEDDETEEKPADESDDEEADEEAEDEDDSEEDAAEEEDEPEETDPDEEPPSGDKATSVSG